MSRRIATAVIVGSFLFGLASCSGNPAPKVIPVTKDRLPPKK
jgi:hypothetical protein